MARIILFQKVKVDTSVTLRFCGAQFQASTRQIESQAVSEFYDAAGCDELSPLRFI
jgi:hypothetical protein